MNSIREFTVTLLDAYDNYVQDKTCALWYEDKEIYSISPVSLLYAELEFYDDYPLETVLLDSTYITIVQRITE